MNAVIDAIVVELETKRNQLDAAILALRGLGVPPAEVKTLPKPKAESNGKPAAPDKPASRSTLTAAQLAEAKALWIAGTMTGTDIGKRFGKSVGWAGVTAKNAGWPAYGSGKNGKPAGVERRCEGCGQRTRTNPCDKCFEKA